MTNAQFGENMDTQYNLAITTAKEWLSKDKKQFIGGQWVAPVNGQYFDNISPVNGKPFCQIPRSDRDDIELALTAEAGYSNYLWSTGETTSEIIVDPADVGNYFVTVTRPNIIGNDCSYTHSFDVLASDEAEIIISEEITKDDWHKEININTVNLKLMQRQWKIA